MSWRAAPWIFALVPVLTGVAGARADAVGPPPSSCPPGSLPQTGHMGPHCAPTRCSDTADCARFSPAYAPIAGIECLPAGLCVGEVEAPSGWGNSREMSFTYGSCASDAECPEGIPCRSALRCVAPGSTPGPVGWLPSRSAQAPSVHATPPVATASCGALGLIALVLIGGASLGLAARSRARRARAEAVRARLLAGAASQAELESLAHSARELSVALAPIAQRVRVEVDEEGEMRFTVDDGADETARAQRARAKA